MTWAQLLYILQQMETAKHVSMDQPIEVFIDGSFYSLDVFESLHTGCSYFIPAVKEEGTDG